MFPSMLPSTAYITFWPGDDVEANLLENCEYKDLSSKRMQSAQTFLRGPQFTGSVLKACSVSFATWRYIREVESGPSKRSKFHDDEPCSDSDEEFEYVSTPEKIRGVARGQKGFLQEARKLVKSKNALAEYFINRSGCPNLIRLEVYRSLDATGAYLSDKNMPYVGPLCLCFIPNPCVG